MSTEDYINIGNNVLGNFLLDTICTYLTDYLHRNI